MSQDPHNLSPANMARDLGLARLSLGRQVADESIERVFSIAAKETVPARLLRVGGPSRFRADVIACIRAKESCTTPGYSLLLDERIPEIEFLLAHPYSDTFLARMDAEEKNAWDIWRVRDEVLEFARALLRASDHRVRNGLAPITVAFHRAELIWNLAIAEGVYTVARAYHGPTTGHGKEVADLHLQTGATSRLAESFMSYYLSIRNDSRTFVLQSEDDLRSLGTWASLFKGNAILTPSDSNPEHVEKSCLLEPCQSAEKTWLSSRPTGRYFHPVALARSKNRKTPWLGETLCLHRVKGPTASEFLSHLQKTAVTHRIPVDTTATIAGCVVLQACRALREFRDTAREPAQSGSKMRSYPWKRNLTFALDEVARFVTFPAKNWRELRTEAQRLGAVLRERSKTPFRDAHLKNRIVALDESVLDDEGAGLCTWISETRTEDRYKVLRDSTYDIDFETGRSLVTEWDDPLHILCFDGHGLGLSPAGPDLLAHVARWWRAPQSKDDAETMWLTLMARALREYCRRLWYDHVMPHAYSGRYGLEDRDHFLGLAVLGATNVDGYSHILDFLEECESRGDALWYRARRKDSEKPVAPRFPLDILTYTKPSVFISYSGYDESFANYLVRELKRHGIRVWIARDNIEPGDPIAAKIDEGLANASVMIAIVSSSSVASTWCKEEWMAALTRAIEDKSKVVIPALLEKCDPGPLLGQRSYVDFTSKDLYDDGLSRILEKILLVG